MVSKKGWRREDRPEIVDLFNEIQSAFPHLEMILNTNHAHVDLDFEIPVQAGLSFPINLNLQGDELHISSGAFWLSYYPCHRDDVRRAYLDTVRGLLSGEYRLLEHRRGSKVAKVELQKPAEDGWETIGTSGSAVWLPFEKRTLVVVQNC